MDGRSAADWSKTLRQQAVGARGKAATTPQRLSRRIYEDLKKDIISLRIKPGTAMQEQELAFRYSGSRTPVREALSRLLEEELVQRRGRIYTVRAFTPDEVQDLYEVREGLEKMAVRLAIERASDPELEELAAQLREHDAAMVKGDVARFNHVDTCFHLSIAKLARNALLERQLALMHDKVKVVRSRELSHRRGMMNATADHRRILEAMLRRDVGIAEAEMRYHVRSVIALYRGFQEPRPDGLIVPNAEGMLLKTQQKS
jgi:DNA-binding GntR family transcriptional regulator